MRENALLASVERALEGFGTPCAGETVVVGLSGGADSMALTHALATLAPRLSFSVLAVHLDHGLRADSEADAAFCRDSCARFGIAFGTARADVRARAEREGGGIEEAGRKERHAYLRRVKDAVGAAAIALGHTRDDQAETFLMRLLRGSGSAGLSAMRAHRGDLIRPLLGVGRRDVLAYLAENGLDWREDPSNADPAFLRNRVRHELLPYLEGRFNPAIRETLARTAGLLADEADVLEAEAETLFARASRSVGASVRLDRAPLMAAPPAVARRTLRRALATSGGLRGVSASHVETILAVSRSRTASGRRLPLPGGREALFRFDEIALGPRSSPARPFSRALPVPGRVEVPGGITIVTRTADPETASKETGEWSAIVAVPRTAGLVVRSRRVGDRVRVRGREMSLKRFLMAERVPADVRGGLPLVASGATVLWVPGLPSAAPTRGGRLVHVSVLGANRAPLAGRARGKEARP
jgi:tRNA(Ile)-lysidine synthase